MPDVDPDREVFQGGPPVVLHIPGSATGAELLHSDDVWMISYLTDQGREVENIDQTALAAALGNDADSADAVISYIEIRLQHYGGNPVRSIVVVGVEAAWTF